MSTKTTIFTILAVVGAALGVLAQKLGLALDPVTLLAGVAGILVYIFGSLKTDIAGLNQPAVWTDPNTYIAMITAVLTALTSAGVALPFNLSPEMIIAILAAIMTAIFKPTKVARALAAKRAAVRFNIV